jgi:hypothetical protein
LPLHAVTRKWFYICPFIFVLAAPSSATPELPRINDLIRVVTLHAAVMASGSLTYLVGCGIASNDSYQVSYF